MCRGEPCWSNADQLRNVNQITSAARSPGRGWRTSIMGSMLPGVTLLSGDRAGRGAPQHGSVWVRRVCWQFSGSLVALPYLVVVAIGTAIVSTSLLLRSPSLFDRAFRFLRGPVRMERDLASTLLGVRLATVSDLPNSSAEFGRRDLLRTLDRSGVGRTSLWLLWRAVVGVLWLAATLVAAVLVALTVWALTQDKAVEVNSWTSGRGLGAWWVAGATVAWLGVCSGLEVVVGRTSRRLSIRWLGPSPDQRLESLARHLTQADAAASAAAALHDSIGHALNVIVLQATAARCAVAATSTPELVAAALTNIETLGRSSLDDLDDALSVLRGRASRSDGPRPAGTLSAALDELAISVRTAGLPLRYVNHGDLDAVPEAVAELALRVAREGCTNVLRHAGLVATTLSSARRAGRLIILIDNERSHAAPRRPGARTRSGTGLVGLRTSVDALGGTIEAEPTPDGGFSLRVELPLPDDLPIVDKVPGQIRTTDSGLTT